MTRTTISVTDLSYLETACGKVEQFEGRVHWMYLDSEGNVTVGIGRMLATAKDAAALPFQTIAGRPATIDEVEADFNRVHAMQKDHLPTYYAAVGSVVMQDKDIEALLYSVIAICDRALRALFVHYDSWPVSAKLATIDMVYNLGISGFRKYSHLIGALNEEDWPDAAKQCARNESDAAFAERNYWTRTNYLNAGVQVAAPEVLHGAA